MSRRNQRSTGGRLLIWVFLLGGLIAALIGITERNINHLGRVTDVDCTALQPLLFAGGELIIHA